MGWRICGLKNIVQNIEDLVGMGSCLCPILLHPVVDKPGQLCFSHATSCSKYEGNGISLRKHFLCLGINAKQHIGMCIQ